MPFRSLAAILFLLAATITTASAQTYTVLYKFKGGTDGTFLVEESLHHGAACCFGIRLAICTVPPAAMPGMSPDTPRLSK